MQGQRPALGYSLLYPNKGHSDKNLNIKTMYNPINKWPNESKHNVQKTYKRPINEWQMFTILSYKGQADENDTEVPSHPS